MASFHHVSEGCVKSIPLDKGFLSFISSCLLDNNVDALIQVWRFSLLKDGFELENPETGVVCFARGSVRNGSTNIVFFSDKFYGNKFCLVQNTDFFNCLITASGGVYCPFLDFRNPHFRSAIKSYNDMIRSGKIVDDCFYLEAVFAGFAIGKPRPFHCLYDTYKNLSEIENLNGKKVFIEKHRKYYFDPCWVLEDCTIVDTKGTSEFYFFPNTIGQYRANAKSSKRVKHLMEEMESKVYKKIVGNDVLVNSCEGHVALWIGVTGQKRSWLDQVYGYCELIKSFMAKFVYVTVYVDGITAPHGKEVEVAEDEWVFDKIRKEFIGEKAVKFISVIGKDYSVKIENCAKIDFFVANAGTGSIVPLRICKKPGVLHSNDSIYAFPDDYKGRVQFVDSNSVTTVKDSTGVGMLESYSFEWNEILESAKKITLPNKVTQEFL